MLLIYLILIRPIIKSMKSEVQQHYKTVEQLEYEQLTMLEQEPVEPPLPIDDAITALRQEVQQNQVPTAFIIKNWIRKVDGVVKILHLLRCCKISIITTYASTPK